MSDKHNHSSGGFKSQHQTNDKIHELYHEAQRRLKLTQQVVQHSTQKSLLLPAPNNIIFELFNTVVKEWPAGDLLSFIDRGIKDYFETNWENKLTRHIILRLKREQVVDLCSGLKDIPTISEVIPVRQSETTNEIGLQNRSKIINDIYEHVTWRVRTGNVTQIVSLLAKLIIDDGYNRGKLKIELYDDVAPCFQEWRANHLIKLYAFGNAPANDQKLILASTTGGDMTKWVANYIDGSDKRHNPDLIRKLATALRDKTKNCFYLTNDLNDAVQSYETGSLRGVIVIDRLQNYQNLTKSLNLDKKLESLITSGKIFVVSSLSCIEFAPDPISDKCC